MNTVDKDLRNRIDILNWTLPLALILLGILNQFAVTTWFRLSGDSLMRSGIEILLTFVLGPLLVFSALKYIGSWMIAREETAQQLQTEERHLARIMNTAADAILAVDAQSRIDAWNHGAEILLGYAAKEVVGRSFFTLLGSSAAAELEARWLLETANREGFIYRHETHCWDISGHMLDVEMTATRLNDNNGQPAGISVILRNISRRKRHEAESKRINAILDQQATKRAHQLAEKIEQLGRANDDLRQLDQTRSEFVSLVSHQIRTPLTNMAGAVQRMQTDCKTINPTCTRMFTIFEQQVARLNRLVQDVLSVTQIEAGEMYLQLEPISILPVIRQSAQQVWARTPTRSIYLPDKPGLPMVYADRDRVTEVLSNLLDNADKYSSPDKDIVIGVRADQSEVTITVRDFGPGLPVKDLERVFHKFYRGSSGDSQTVYGYGLGLYVCRLLVEAHNGRIWAENHSSGGAVFSFSLPVWER